MSDKRVQCYPETVYKRTWSLSQLGGQTNTILYMNNMMRTWICTERTYIIKCLEHSLEMKYEFIYQQIVNQIRLSITMKHLMFSPSTLSYCCCNASYNYFVQGSDGLTPYTKWMLNHSFRSECRIRLSKWKNESKDSNWCNMCAQ